MTHDTDVTRDHRIRVLIVDDHPVVRTGLRGMLSEEPRFEVVGEAEDGLRALIAVRDLEPDVALMDLRMPRMDGVAAIESIAIEHPSTRVLVLTTYDSDSDILRAIEAGATGYLLKDAPRDELFRAIESTAAGDSWLTPQVASRMMTRFRTPAEEPLSDRELEVLRHVARGSSNKEIAASLYISEATVKTHLVHIYRKLDVASRTAAVTAAIERRLLSL
jgi:DNA-binding NarL/FixJ family response regulator